MAHSAYLRSDRRTFRDNVLFRFVALPVNCFREDGWLMGTLMSILYTIGIGMTLWLAVVTFTVADRAGIVTEPRKGVIDAVYYSPATSVTYNTRIGDVDVPQTINTPESWSASVKLDDGRTVTCPVGSFQLLVLSAGVGVEVKVGRGRLSSMTYCNGLAIR